MSEPRPRPRVFLSYSHLDEDWKDRVVGHLRELEGRGLLEVWDDRRMGAGDDWRREIQGAVEASDVAVLLVSAHFLGSSFIMDVEVPSLLRRRDSAGLRGLPLIVEPCSWRRVGWLAAMTPWPADGKALSGEGEAQIDRCLAELGAEVLGRGPRQGAATPTRPAPERHAPRGPVDSLVVLPFLDLSPGKDLGHVCDGIAEGLTDVLARLEGLRLAPRTSISPVEGEPVDPRAIGEQLDVRAVLEGSVRRSGNRLRVTLRLSRAAGATQIWCERFDGDLDDVFDLEDEIAARVGDSLPAALGRAPG